MKTPLSGDGQPATIETKIETHLKFEAVKKGMYIKVVKTVRPMVGFDTREWQVTLHEGEVLSNENDKITFIGGKTFSKLEMDKHTHIEQIHRRFRHPPDIDPLIVPIPRPNLPELPLFG